MENAVALGTFDGIHAGHRAVLEQTAGYRRTAITFTVPPKAVITGNYELLMSPEERREKLLKIGMDEVRMYDFSDVRELSAKEFLDAVCREYRPALISCGFNYRFGKGASGDTAYLEEYCRKNGINFKCCAPVLCEGEAVSSTAVREYIKDGRVETANALMYGKFGFSAVVVGGDRRGRTIGFPTANQLYPEKLVKLRFGVYLTETEINGVKYKGITNFGIRPTYPSLKPACETHIADFSGDLYGKTLDLRFLRFLREEKKFSSLDELKSAIENDFKYI